MDGLTIGDVMFLILVFGIAWWMWNFIEENF